MRIVILATILMAACSPQHRLNRLITKHPELAKTTTIVKLDTIITAGSIIDSVFIMHNEVDTITIGNDTITTTVIKYRDKYHVRTVLKPMHIIRRDTIPVQVITATPPKLVKFIPWYWWVITALIMLVALFRK